MPRGFLTRRGLGYDMDDDEEGSGSGPLLQFIPVGDWDGAMRRINRMPKEIKDVSVRAQLRIGNEIVKRVKNHIVYNDLPWKPHSPHYEKAKVRYGLDDRIYIAHGNYYRAIESWATPAGNMVYAGVRRGKYTRSLTGRKKSKIELAAIGALLEFGTRKIPARPLWNATIKEMGNTPGIRNLFIKHFINMARAAGIPINKLRDDLGWKR